MSTQEEMITEKMANLFKLFGDGTRIKILYCLFEKERNVYDICQTIGVSQSAASHQLKILRDGNLVVNRRQGQEVFYRLADDHVKTIIGQGFEHVTED